MQPANDDNHDPEQRQPDAPPIASTARPRLSLWLAAFCLVLIVLAALVWRKQAPAAEVTITRGPFLQNVSSDRATVCWRTSSPTSCVLRVKDAAGNLHQENRSAEATRHSVLVDSLSPGTTYHYAIEMGRSSPPDGQGSIITPPPRGKPIEFVVWGDSRSNPQTCGALADLIRAGGAPVVIHSGDFISGPGDPDEWDDMFFTPCRDLLRSVALWPAIGNHELGTGPDGIDGRTLYADTFDLPGNELYYSFDVGDAHFLVLDSNPDFSDDEAQFAFAVKDLESTDAAWRFVVWHHPVFNAGNHASHLALRHRYCPLLARTNVDMIITGHDHNYQLAKPIRHRYEPLQRRPYWHLVSGGGGANLYPVRDNEPWSNRGGQTNHFVTCRIEGTRLDAEVVDLEGRVIDRFTIDPSQPPSDVVAYELIELDRIYRELTIADAAGQTTPPLFLEENQTTGSIHYRLVNPLPEPLTVRLSFDGTAGLAFDPEQSTHTIPPQVSSVVSFTFTRPAGNTAHPLAGPEVALDSPVGQRTVRAPVPPIALRPHVTAAPVTEKITIDGTVSEPAWQHTPAVDTFLSHTPTAITGMEGPAPPTVRLLHDAEKLYLLVQSNYGPDQQPKAGKGMENTDHAAVYLNGPKGGIRFWIDMMGLVQQEGTANGAVQAGHTESDRQLTWEIALPLSAVTDPREGTAAPLAFNLTIRRAGRHGSLVPTFGQAPSAENSARLNLE